MFQKFAAIAAVVSMAAVASPAVASTASAGLQVTAQVVNNCEIALTGGGEGTVGNPAAAVTLALAPYDFLNNATKDDTNSITGKVKCSYTPNGNPSFTDVSLGQSTSSTQALILTGQSYQGQITANLAVNWTSGGDITVNATIPAGHDYRPDSYVGNTTVNVDF